jgi:O-antigen ligase
LDTVWTPAKKKKKESLGGAFFWLSAFYFVYCARPTDLIPFLSFVPLAKITGGLAALSLLFAAGKTPRKFRDRPKEANYLLIIIALLFASGFLSPIWRGGAVSATIDFAKVYIAWILSFLLITSLSRLRRIIFLQSASVAVVSLAAVVKGHSIPRLSGVIGGFYSNPNDMAFAIVLSLPFCLAFLLTAKGGLRRALWSFGIVSMMVALFLTASRAGFIDLVISGTVCLWNFGIKGKRLYLIAATLFLGVVLVPVAGRTLIKRFAVISGGTVDSKIEISAYGSYEERKLLMVQALNAIVHYPILGVGVGNFAEYSGMWKDVHASYLQIAAEGGLPVLVFYLLFFSRGFANLRWLGEQEHLSREAELFRGALKASLVGFVVGACFAPEAYQFFPYFTVGYTSVLLAMSKEHALVDREPARPPTIAVRALAGAY